MTRLRYIGAAVLLVLSAALYFTGDDTDINERTSLTVSDSINAARVASKE